MAMLSFRIDDTEAAEAQAWAERLGIHRSALLRDALHRHLVGLQGEIDAETWQTMPLDERERSMSAAASWLPAEGWSDWVAMG